MAEVQNGHFVITAEVRSFNNRFLEVSFRLSPALSALESELMEVVRKYVHRGKCYVNITIQGKNHSELGLRVNVEKLKAVRGILEELYAQSGVDEPMRLEYFFKFPEILEPSTDLASVEELRNPVKEVLTQALIQLKAMREQEGAVLVKDLKQRIESLQEKVKVIESISKRCVPEIYARLRDRVQKLIADTELDENRLSLEIALLADRMDVTEECVRLRSHCELFLRTLDREPVVGKKLTFLLQEMNREANTISSKSSDAEVTHLSVEIKEEVEKLREQVQNLE